MTQTMSNDFLKGVRLVEELSPLEELSLINISYSRLNTILDETYGCEAKYFYNYIIGLPSGSNQYAVLGNIVHRALENSVKNDTELDEPTLFAEFEYAKREFDPDGKIESKVITAGITMLRDYYERHKKERYSTKIAQYPEIIGNEESFEIVIGNGKIRGFIDLVYQLKNDIYIIDYKTGSTEVAKYKVPTNTQLGIYALAMKKRYPDKKIHASLYYLKSNNLKTHTFEEEDYINTIQTLKGQISNLVNLPFYRPTQNARTCRYCEYATGICPTGKSRTRNY